MHELQRLSLSLESCLFVYANIAIKRLSLSSEYIRLMKLTPL